MQEEFLIKKQKTGTIVHFFNTDINEMNYSTSTVPAILHTNFAEGNPIEFGTFDNISTTDQITNITWNRNIKQNPHNMETRMDFVQKSNLEFVSGRTFSQKFDYEFDESEINVITDWFVNSMEEQFSKETISFVFVETIKIDDLYVDIKMERSFDVLDTLNIYNKVVGETPSRESLNGVVFGKIEAIQKITDDNGNKIRIPLRNVPVGVFIPSEDYPTPNNIDADGERLRLNYRPITTTTEDYPIEYGSNYFNSESAEFDNQFLTHPPLEKVKIHTTFSNVVYTNENGEFFLHNVEVGAQILFFEINLLTQGLTKDEVALNFFPYPPNFENISIDTIPHYFYRAIPIDVAPTWGDSQQSGYTEVNVSINLDLRKWATYIIPPVSYKNMEIGSFDYNKITKAPLTVQVRDMSKFDSSKINETDFDKKIETYPSKRIQMVEIEDVFNKNENQQWEWSSEFSQIKDRALFFKYGFHAIKLPANIYDSDSYKTNVFGDPNDSTFSKGVWLCAYQLKVFLINEKEFYRTTGAALISATDWSNKKWCDRDHFHCCLNKPIDVIKNEATPNTNAYDVRAEGIGQFPYERAWTKDYPSKYKIPKQPTKLNFVRPNLQEYYFDNDSQNGVLRPYIESPRYSDGDLIHGNSWLGWNGFGLSMYNSTLQYTDFATDVIGGNELSNMYKYETIGAGRYGQNQYFGCYANGYYNAIDNVPSNSISNFGVGASSSVLNGEEFQRVECGYGYFLFPSSLPRLIPFPSVLIGFNYNQVDNSQNQNIDKIGYISFTEQGSNDPWWNLKALTNQYNSYSILKNSRSISMDLGKKLSTNAIINDRLNIYRIVDGKYRLSYDTKQPIIPTGIKINIDNSSRCYEFILTNTGDVTVKFVCKFNDFVVVEPSVVSGVITKVLNGEIITLLPGSRVVVRDVLDAIDLGYTPSSPSSVVQFTIHTLPGNAEFNEFTNMYTKANYKLDITYNGSVQGNKTKIVNISENATTGIDNWWVKTIYQGVAGDKISNGINADNQSGVKNSKIENNNNQD